MKINDLKFNQMIIASLVLCLLSCTSIETINKFNRWGNSEKLDDAANMLQGQKNEKEQMNENEENKNNTPVIISDDNIVTPVMVSDDEAKSDHKANEYSLLWLDNINKEMRSCYYTMEVALYEDYLKKRKLLEVMQKMSKKLLENNNDMDDCDVEKSCQEVEAHKRLCDLFTLKKSYALTTFFTKKEKLMESCVASMKKIKNLSTYLSRKGLNGNEIFLDNDKNIKIRYE